MFLQRGKNKSDIYDTELFSSCCTCFFKKKPTEQPDPRLNWTIIDVEARFAILILILILIFIFILIAILISSSLSSSSSSISFSFSLFATLNLRMLIWRMGSKPRERSVTNWPDDWGWGGVLNLDKKKHFLASSASLVWQLHSHLIKLGLRQCFGGNTKPIWWHSDLSALSAGSH